jgi:hypothetical protein
MARQGKTEEQRFWEKVNKDAPGGCWIWLGARRGGHGNVYGQFRREKGPKVQAHVWAWENKHGPLPVGHRPDHLCRIKLCVNPIHMEPVTSWENTKRGLAPTAVNARKTHCIRGHPLSGDNLITRPDGHRKCRTCKRRSDRARRRALVTQ